MGAYASEPLTFFYTCPHVECVCEGWCGCVCVPYLGECVYESMLSLMRPHMRDSWVRIHLTCGCVYIWLVGAYATLVGAYTVGCVYSGVRIQGVRIQWGAYTVGCVYSGVRIQWGAYTGVRIQECVYIWTCAYAILVGAYARLVGAYTYDLWVRIHMTCGCVYIWLVGAYTVGCVYSGVRIQGCVCRGVYAGVGLGVNNAYKSVWCVSTK